MIYNIITNNKVLKFYYFTPHQINIPFVLCVGLFHYGNPTYLSLS